MITPTTIYRPKDLGRYLRVRVSRVNGRRVDDAYIWTSDFDRGGMTSLTRVGRGSVYVSFRSRWRSRPSPYGP